MHFESVSLCQGSMYIYVYITASFSYETWERESFSLFLCLFEFSGRAPSRYKTIYILMWRQRRRKVEIDTVFARLTYQSSFATLLLLSYFSTLVHFFLSLFFIRWTVKSYIAPPNVLVPRKRPTSPYWQLFHFTISLMKNLLYTYIQTDMCFHNSIDET